MDIKQKFRNKAFWVTLFALFALTGQVFNLYSVPDQWDTWVKAVLALMSAAGIFINPNTSGISD